MKSFDYRKGEGGAAFHELVVIDEEEHVPAPVGIDTDLVERVRTQRSKLSNLRRTILSQWMHGTPIEEIAAVVNYPAEFVETERMAAIEKLRDFALSN